MAFLLRGAGFALIGGFAAIATGALIELLRLLLSPQRRAVIFNRPFRENLRHLIGPPTNDQLGLQLHD
jgi:hypothetical protein